MSKLYAFVSDLHLGDGSPADGSFSNELLLEYLNYLLGIADEVIVGGDILELWQFQLGSVWAAHTPVIELIDCHPKIRKLVGNHDLDRASYPGTHEYYVTEHEGVRLAACHMHQFDPACSGWGAKVSRWLVKHVWTPLEKVPFIGALYSGFIAFCDVRSKQTNRDPAIYEKGAVSLAKKYNADFVIGFHTHHSLIAMFPPSRVGRTKSSIYMNAGRACDGLLQYGLVVIDPGVQSNCRVFKYPDDKGKENL